MQTTDNGIQVYGPMINATNMGPLYATYTKAELDACTGVNDEDQYYGMDVSADGRTMLLGAPFGNVYVVGACAPPEHLPVGNERHPFLAIVLHRRGRSNPRPLLRRWALPTSVRNLPW